MLSDFIDREITSSRITSKKYKSELQEIFLKIAHRNYMAGNGLWRRRQIIGRGSPLLIVRRIVRHAQVRDRN